jgi:hypothetical protein
MNVGKGKNTVVIKVATIHAFGAGIDLSVIDN